MSGNSRSAFPSFGYLIDPFDVVDLIVAAALRHAVLLLPNGFKVNALHTVAVLKREREVDFGCNGGLCLLDARSDAPVFRDGSGAVAFAGRHEIIERRVHIQALLDRVAVAVGSF